MVDVEPAEKTNLPKVDAIEANKIERDKIKYISNSITCYTIFFFSDHFAANRGVLQLLYKIGLIYMNLQTA